jgi:predicted Rdx family selenoprotein
MRTEPKLADMTRYQFQIDDETWDEWKRTVPREKTLEQRITELIEADRDGRVEDE